MNEAEQFDDDTDMAVRLLLDELGSIIGRRVALVAFQEQDGRISVMAHPSCTPAVLRAMGGLDWVDAANFAQELELPD